LEAHPGSLHVGRGAAPDAASPGVAQERLLSASVAASIDEAELRAVEPSAAQARILLLSDPLAAGPAETVAGGGPVRERLARLAQRSGHFVAAAVVEQLNADAGHPLLALVVVGPDGSVLVHGYASVPVVPISGLAFSRSELRDVWRTVNIGGVPVGIAAVGDAEAAIPLLSDRGARLVLLTGGPVSNVQIERFADSARLSRVALLIAGRCANASSCIAAAAIDSSGKADRTGGRIRVLARAPNSSPPSAKGLPDLVPQPARYDYSPRLAELGRMIFFDRTVSDSGTVSCASCHDPSAGFSDRHPLGEGVLGRPTSRNVISLLNVAFRPLLRWDGYESSLENFIRYPLSGHSEMDSHRLDDVLGRIARSPRYVALFSALFGRNAISFATVEKALATYMRTLVSGNSPFDRAVVDGRRAAMTKSAWRGYDLFNGKAGCAACHSYSENSPFFTDSRASNTGLGWDSAKSRYRDGGVGAIGSAALSGSFRTPTLRDVARTGPYMHDGSIGTLRGVIDYFDRGGGDGPGRDPRLRSLHLSEQDKQDLEAFLIALTGTTSFDGAGRRTDAPSAAAR
jgi:cytochrome c peroxidase